MNTERHYKLLFAFLVILIMSFACRLPFGSPSPTRTPLAAIPADPQQAIEQVATQFSQNSGSFSMTLTEAQINALVSEQLKSQTEYSVINPQVDLQPGAIVVNGEMQSGMFSTAFQFTVQPSLNEEGIQELKLTDAKLGPLPIPDTLNATISETFNKMLYTAIAGSGQTVVIQKIEITPDTMTISGQK